MTRRPKTWTYAEGADFWDAYADRQEAAAAVADIGADSADADPVTRAMAVTEAAYRRKLAADSRRDAARIRDEAKRYGRA